MKLCRIVYGQKKWITWMNCNENAQSHAIWKEKIVLFTKFSNFLSLLNVLKVFFFYFAALFSLRFFFCCWLFSLLHQHQDTNRVKLWNKLEIEQHYSNRGKWKNRKMHQLNKQKEILTVALTILCTLKFYLTEYEQVYDKYYSSRTFLFHFQSFLAIQKH